MYGSSFGLLKKGDTVALEGLGLSCSVGDLLGSGSQGEVYEAGMEGQSLAIKWYYPSWSTSGHRQVLSKLISIGPPDPGFLWPFGLATQDGRRDFGYAMPLREERYRPLSDVVTFQVDPTLKVLAHTARNLAHKFLCLHANGLSYKDISLGNVFFDPCNGDVVICDNDNAGLDGEQTKGILGTPKFIAPEIVRGEVGASSFTDLHSLAVLLFYLLMAHHPLEGSREARFACLDAGAMASLYGSHPMFIFDPHNADNNPVPGMHDNVLALWPLYPRFLQELFTRAFTAGLADPQERVRETEWRAAMAQLADAVTHCPRCGAENYLDPGSPDDNLAGLTCWSCRAEFRRPLLLRMEHTTVAINHDTELLAHHTVRSRQYDYSSAMGRVVSHPSDPSLWGIQNLSGETWKASFPDGTTVGVAPHQSVLLRQGARLDFGSRDAWIR